MTFSYDPNLGAQKDKVRLLAGDTISDGHLFEDEEIVAVAEFVSGANYVAAYLLDGAAVRYARKADKAIGATRISYSDASSRLAAMADRLRQQGTTEDGSGVSTLDTMKVGGISIAERNDLITGDSDRIQPNFRIGMDDVRDVVQDHVPLVRRD